MDDHAIFLTSETVSGKITLRAVAFDSHSGIARYEIYDGPALLANLPVTPPITTFLWDLNNVAPGLHPLHLRAFDAVGNSGDSISNFNLTVVPDLAPPSVTFRTPVEGAAVTGVVSAQVDASDDRVLERLVFFVDGVQSWQMTSPPFVFPWNTAALTGPHTITATATDSAGKTTSASVHVVVDHTAPTLGVALSPSPPAALWGTVQVQVNAMDDSALNVVAMVDGTPIGSATAPPFAFAWDTRLATDGSHVVKVVVTDAAGNSANSTTNVFVDNRPVAAPKVAISRPLEGAALTGLVSVAVNAMSAVGIAQVDVLDGEVVLAHLPGPVPGAVNWDTTAVPEGAHTLSARATDLRGTAVTSTPVHVFVDRTAPALDVALVPDNPSALSGTVAIVASVADNVAVARVLFFDGSVLLGTATSAPYTFAWDTAVGPDGAHMIDVRAEDAAGNLIDRTVAVFVDNSVPVALDGVAPGMSIGKTFDLRAKTQDDARVATVEFFDGGVSIGVATTAPFHVTFAPGANGAHTLTARATDRAGRISNSAPVVVTADIDAPAVEISAPIAGSVVVGSINLVATVSDDVAVARVLFFDGSTLLGTVTAAPYTLAWNSAAGPDGAHTIDVRAEDTAGNLIDKTVAVVVDNSVPVALDGVAPGMLIGKTFDLRARTQADAQVASVEFFDGGLSIGVATTAPFHVAFAPTANGAHTLTARSTDRAGRINNSAPVVVNADIDAPVVELTPVAGSVVLGAVVHLVATASDLQGVTKVEFYDGVLRLGDELTAPYTQSWNTAGATPGPHTLFARAFDAAGNSTDSKGVVVTVQGKDVTPPTATITAPVNGAAATGVVTFSASATDNVKVARVDFYDGATKVKSLTAAPFSFSWDTTALAAGAHRLTVRAFDSAGNSATSAAVNITVDRTAPNVTLTAPSNGAKVAGTISLTATASDNVAVARVEFWVDGARLCSDSAAPYACPLTLPPGAGKKHTVQAKAFDTADNNRASTIATVTTK